MICPTSGQKHSVASYLAAGKGRANPCLDRIDIKQSRRWHTGLSGPRQFQIQIYNSVALFLTMLLDRYLRSFFFAVEEGLPSGSLASAAAAFLTR